MFKKKLFKIAICLFFVSIATVTGQTTQKLPLQTKFRINGNLTRSINSSIWLIDALAALSDGNLANNGYRVVNGTAIWLIQIWNPSTGVLIKQLTGHTDTVKALVLLPDKTLASGGLDKKIRIWNTAKWEIIRNISTIDYVEKLALLKDGSLASCGGYANYNYTKQAYSFPIQILKPSTGALIRTLTLTSVYSYKVNSLVSLSDRTLATVSYDGYIYIWDLVSDSLIKNMSTNLLNPKLVLLADGNLVCAGFYNYKTKVSLLQIWNPSTGALIRNLTDSYNPAESLVLLPDNTLAIGSRNQVIEIWNTTTRSLNKKINTNQAITALALLSNGFLASSGQLTNLQSDFPYYLLIWS